jgi:autoinducer 2-degrading protein
MPIVTLSGYIEVPNDDLDSVVAELPNHIEATRAKKGCIQFDVSQDKSN